MQLIAALLLFSLVEATRNHHLIKNGEDPHTLMTYMARAAVFLGLPLLSPGFYLIKFICGLFIFWYSFDSILNILRGLPVTYLSDRGIDKLQKKYPHQDFWFFVKLILALVAMGLIMNPQFLLL